MKLHQHPVLIAVAASGLFTCFTPAWAGMSLTPTGRGGEPDAVSNGIDRAGFVTAINVTGVPSVDSFESPNNVVMFMHIGAGNSINGIGWDVVLQTVHPFSLLSDIRVTITDSTGFNGFYVIPGGADENPGGPTHYDSGGQILKLANYSIPDVIAMGDGLIRIEFLDFIDDEFGAVDGIWLSGSIFLQTYAPVPNVGPTSLLAIAGIAGLRRNRRIRERTSLIP
ncbi:MAG: hypothetical protein JNK58_04155 [Phycisphaerae bacterium]|nr:hypothetical protein [Phycisphaerae bacterium]